MNHLKLMSRCPVAVVTTVHIGVTTPPTELENVCLYGTMTDVAKTVQCRQKCCKLSKPCLPNHRLYDPNKEGQREDYFYALILLFTPFRNEDNLIGKTETAEVYSVGADNLH